MAADEAFAYDYREEARAAAEFDAAYNEGKEDERARLLPLLERCVDLAEGVRFNHPEAWERYKMSPLLADLRRELGHQ